MKVLAVKLKLWSMLCQDQLENLGTHPLEWSSLALLLTINMRLAPVLNFSALFLWSDGKKLKKAWRVFLVRNQEVIVNLEDEIMLWVFLKFLNVPFVLHGQCKRVWLHSAFFSVNERKTETLELRWLNWRKNWRNILENLKPQLWIQKSKLLWILCSRLQIQKKVQKVFFESSHGAKNPTSCSPIWLWDRTTGIVSRRECLRRDLWELHIFYAEFKDWK